jgi:hypothetical protein
MSELRDEIRSWIAGHEIANARQRAQVASMTAEEKLRQISDLMISTSLFDMSRRASGDQRVIELWQQLRARWPEGK